MNGMASIFVAIGILLGIMVVVLVFGVFGMFLSPEVELCDDLSLIIGNPTRVTAENICQIQEGQYFIDYEQWIELKGGK